MIEGRCTVVFLWPKVLCRRALRAEQEVHTDSLLGYGDFGGIYSGPSALGLRDGEGDGERAGGRAAHIGEVRDFRARGRQNRRQRESLQDGNSLGRRRDEKDGRLRLGDSKERHRTTRDWQ